MHKYFKIIFEIDTLENLKSKEKNDLIKKLHDKLFPEEYDFMYDSIADANDRARGKNPMSKDYQKEVNEKRASLGVSQLSENGMAVDDSSLDFCKIEINALLEEKKTAFTDSMLKWLGTMIAKTDEIKELIYEQSLYASGIDPNDPSTWTDIMFKNLYKLEEAAALWDLEDVKFTFEEFKQLLLQDPEFRKFRIPKKGMESEDYGALGRS